MPTYLSLSFQYRKSNISVHTVREFCDALLRCGVAFVGGYWTSEGDSYDEIVSWNQQKLEQNFELGEAEHVSHGYKQMRLQYMEFYEVRLFIHNERKQAYFSFELIFPEDDLLIPDPVYEWALRMNQLEKIENLAVQLWEHETMDCIQAGWELAEAPVSYTDIAAGDIPLIEPFCVIPKSILRRRWHVQYREVGRDGVYIRDVERFHKVE